MAAVIVASSALSLNSSSKTFATEICTNTATRPSQRTNDFIKAIKETQDQEIASWLVELGAQNLNKTCSDEEIEKLFEEIKKITDEITGRRIAEEEARQQAEEDAKREAEEEAERQRLLEEDARRQAENPKQETCNHEVIIDDPDFEADCKKEIITDNTKPCSTHEVTIDEIDGVEFDNSGANSCKEEQKQEDIKDLDKEEQIQDNIEPENTSQ